LLTVDLREGLSYLDEALLQLNPSSGELAKPFREEGAPRFPR